MVQYEREKWLAMSVHQQNIDKSWGKNQEESIYKSY